MKYFADAAMHCREVLNCLLACATWVSTVSIDGLVTCFLLNILNTSFSSFRRYVRYYQFHYGEGLPKRSHNSNRTLGFHVSRFIARSLQFKIMIQSEDNLRYFETVIVVFEPWRDFCGLHRILNTGSLVFDQVVLIRKLWNSQKEGSATVDLISLTATTSRLRLSAWTDEETGRVLQH